MVGSPGCQTSVTSLYDWEESAENSFWCGARLNQGRWQYSCDFDFQEATGKNVMLLLVGSANDSAHFKNEKLNRHNYIERTKILAAYLYKMAQLKN